MTAQTYGLPAGRINKIKGEMLAIAEPVEVLALGCSMKPFPKNKGDTMIYRAVIPTGGSTANANSINRWNVNAAAHQVQEGVTPPAESLSYRDVTVVIQQYAVLYSYTDKAANLSEDDIPKDQIDQTARRMGLVREMIRYGVMKAASTVQYAGGLSRATVASTINFNGLSQMSRTLKGNHGEMKTMILAPGPAYDTSAIEASFIVFVHTDAEHDIRRLEDFVPLAKYAGRKPISPREFGSVNNFRFITSPELGAYQDAGATVAATGLYSTTGTNIDVYPYVVCAEECVNDVALNANFDPSHIPANLKTKEDPLGQRGYVSSSFWSAAVVTNPGWIGVIEAGITNLS